MNNELALIFAFAAGMLLGGVFFGGLWWTVRKCVETPYPARWILGSAITRMSITLAGFYFVSAGQLQPLLACVVGFMAARLTVTRLTRPEIQVLANQDQVEISCRSGTRQNSRPQGILANPATKQDTHFPVGPNQEANHAT